MTQLSKIAQVTKKLIVIGLPALILLMIVTLTLSSLIKKARPVVITPKPTPSVLFGPLPPIVFPPSNDFPKNLQLETISGQVPISTDSAKVYFIPQKPLTVFSRKNALEFATKFGFSPPYETINERTYSFSNFEGKQLIMDISNNNFSYNNPSKPFASASETTLPDEKKAVEEAKKFFTSIGTPSNVFDIQKVSYYDAVEGELKLVKNPKSAVIVRVDFFKSAIEKIPIVASSNDKSQTYIIFTSNEANLESIYKASFQNWEPDTSTIGTYPVISGQTAWNTLVSGKGFIQSIAFPQETQTVRDGYVAYYQPDSYFPYLLPVYVFTGDNNFIAFVPAVDPAWTSN